MRPEHHRRTRPDSGRCLRRAGKAGRRAQIASGGIQTTLAVLLGHGRGGELDQGDGTGKQS